MPRKFSVAAESAKNSFKSVIPSFWQNNVDWGFLNNKIRFCASEWKNLIKAGKLREYWFYLTYNIEI